eukprot:8339763-Pyramimonas_sp.AAC.1
MSSLTTLLPPRCGTTSSANSAGPRVDGLEESASLAPAKPPTLARPPALSSALARPKTGGSGAQSAVPQGTFCAPRAAATEQEENATAPRVHRMPSKSRKQYGSAEDLSGVRLRSGRPPMSFSSGSASQISTSMSRPPSRETQTPWSPTLRAPFSCDPRRVLPQRRRSTAPRRPRHGAPRCAVAAPTRSAPPPAQAQPVPGLPPGPEPPALARRRASRGRPPPRAGGSGTRQQPPGHAARPHQQPLGRAAPPRLARAASGGTAEGPHP